MGTCGDDVNINVRMPGAATRQHREVFDFNYCLQIPADGVEIGNGDFSFDCTAGA